MEKFKEIVKDIIRIFVYILPVVAVFVFGYIVYLKITRNHIYDTQKDIAAFVRNVNTRYNTTIYKNFDTDFVSYSGYLPMDLKIKSTDHGNEIINRFGGKMVFKESPKTVEERKEFKYLSRERKMFAAHYNGLGAYTIMFTELKTQECVGLATTDWKKIVPNFMGLEASYVSKKHPFNGVENLNFQILEDNENETAEASRDEGVISRTPLVLYDALQACACRGDSCQVALKFK
ncbi:MAG: hypothetical protein IJ770_04460 [Alphaproteobacteria bacterium]|nr:hypothetical protein [Alphaproteobacteria bacterium]